MPLAKAHRQACGQTLYSFERAAEGSTPRAASVHSHSAIAISDGAECCHPAAASAISARTAGKNHRYGKTDLLDYPEGGRLIFWVDFS
jgi:hypothetical protein